MEENENIYEKLRDLFGMDPGSFNVLQDKIDVNLQVCYFDVSRRVKKDLNPGEVLGSIGFLRNKRGRLEEKKEILAKLASVEDVQAYRFLESFLKEAPPELQDWTALACQESRMMLMSGLLDENQVLISTGLGGKGHKLRYFSVVIRKDEFPLSEIQHKIIRNEFEFVMNKFGAEIEYLRFRESIATIMTVIPLNVPVKTLFQEAINECNNYGDFLDDSFIITNVKELSFGEIKEYLNNKNDIIREYED